MNRTGALRRPGWPGHALAGRHSLEDAICRQIRREPVEGADIAYHVLGRDAQLYYSLTPGLVQDGLGLRGVLDVETVKRLQVIATQKYTLPERTHQRVSGRPAAPVQALLNAAQQERPALWKQLIGAIDSGIKRRQDTSSAGGADF